MTEDLLYTYSSSLHSLHQEVESLLQFHYYRYKYLVYRSELGTSCRYAIVTKQFGESEEATLRNYLESLKDTIDTALNSLPKETELTP